MASQHPDRKQSSPRVQWVLRLGMFAFVLGGLGIIALQGYAVSGEPLILLLAAIVLSLMTLTFMLEYLVAMSPQLRQLRDLL
jgi:hypothetical protein